MGFFGRIWSASGQITRGRGLLQWFGLWDLLVTVVAGLVAYFWRGFASLTEPVRLLAALTTVAMVVIIIFGIVRIAQLVRPTKALAPTGLIDAHGSLYYTKQSNLVVPKAVATVTVIAIFVVVGKSDAINALVSKFRPPSDTAIFMECSIFPVPVITPAGESSKVILLSHNRMATQHWGFFEIDDHSWPDDSLLKQSAKSHNPGIFGYKCTTSNHGPIGLTYLLLAIDFSYGPHYNTNIRYTAIINALDSGQNVDFYIFNDCNVGVSGIWQTTALAQVFGEPKPRTIPLRRAFRNPVEQLMDFAPTRINWSGQGCE